MTDAAPAPTTDQHARLELEAGPVSLKLEVRVSPAGLMAIGGLVSGVLLSTAALVWSATAAPRRHPVAWRIGRRL